MAALALFCRLKDSFWILISLSRLAQVHGQFQPALTPEYTCSSPICTTSSSVKPITGDKHKTASHWSLSFLPCPRTTDPSGSSQGNYTKSPSSSHLLCLNPPCLPTALRTNPVPSPEPTRPPHEASLDLALQLPSAGFVTISLVAAPTTCQTHAS